jgi:hypothetical protein
MKVKDLVALLSTRDQEADLYVLTKDGREQVGRVVSGKFFNTLDISTKVQLTVDQAEQSLYQLATYDQLTTEIEEDIARTIGQDRIDVIKAEIKTFQEEMIKARSQVSSESFFQEDNVEHLEE